MGWYLITARNEKGYEISFESKTSGNSVTSGDKHEDTYKIFDRFFNESENVNIIIKNGYDYIYMGVLDTKYY